MLHANDSSPTKVHRSQMMRMKREVFPRAPQVSVVTRTVYASSTVTATSPPQVENVPIPLGPIVGGIIGGMLIVLVAVGGWWWWGSRLRASKAKGAKARRAQNLTAARAGHSKTDSTETLKTNGSSKPQEPLSEKIKEKQSANAGSQESVQKPSAILAQERNKRPPFMHQTNSSASLASSKYAPARPSPLALNVVTRAPSAMSEHLPTVLVTAPSQPKSPEILSPQTAALRSLVPLPPKVNVVPPSPPPPVHRLPAPAADRNQRESVQSVQSVQSAASEYSLDSPVGIAYGGDELEREPYINPRDEWRSSQDNIKSQMRTAAQARGPFNT